DTIQLSLDKTVQTGLGKHQLNMLLGSDRFNSTLKRHEILSEFSVGSWGLVRDIGYRNGSYNNPYVYELKDQAIYSKN
ncbi:hypothetical protein GUF79_19385, partial [Xanthomonas citri pv. citri]|nr:hypothetical protein [Xanthomonas citri pv. citri]